MYLNRKKNKKERKVSGALSTLEGTAGGEEDNYYGLTTFQVKTIDQE